MLFRPSFFEYHAWVCNLHHFTHYIYLFKICSDLASSYKRKFKYLVLMQNHLKRSGIYLGDTSNVSSILTYLHFTALIVTSKQMTYWKVMTLRLPLSRACKNRASSSISDSLHSESSATYYSLLWSYICIMKCFCLLTNSLSIFLKQWINIVEMERISTSLLPILKSVWLCQYALSLFWILSWRRHTRHVWWSW